MEAKLAQSVVWHQFNPKTNTIYLLSYQATTQKTESKVKGRYKTQHSFTSTQEGHTLYTLRGFAMQNNKLKPEQLFEVKDLAMNLAHPTGADAAGKESQGAAPPPRLCKTLIVRGSCAITGCLILYNTTAR